MVFLISIIDGQIDFALCLNRYNFTSGREDIQVPYVYSFLQQQVLHLLSSFIQYFVLKLGQTFSGDEEFRCDSGLFLVVLSDCPRGSCQLSAKAVKLDGFALSALYLLLSCMCLQVHVTMFVCGGDLKIGNKSQDAGAQACAFPTSVTWPGSDSVQLSISNRPFCCGEMWWFVTYQPLPCSESDLFSR